MPNHERQQKVFITVFVAAAAIASAFIVMVNSYSDISYAQLMDQMRNQTQIRNLLIHTNATSSNMTTAALPSSALGIAPYPRIQFT